MATILKATQDNICHAAEKLRSGDIVAIPTETVYGLAADARNEQAVQKIYDLKQRPNNNPLIVHVHNLKAVEKLVKFRSSKQRDTYTILQKFWPGPLTLILEKSAVIPNSVTAGRNTVAIRIPKHKVALDLLAQCSFPLAAPSANRFTQISPTTAVHVAESFENSDLLILDGGAADCGLESSILSLVEDPPVLLRYGMLRLEDLTKELGEITIRCTHAKSEEELEAPGMHYRHYAPKTPLIFLDELNPENSNARIGQISFSSHNSEKIDYAKSICLSTNGTLEEIAAKLFAALRELDRENLDLIVIDRCEESGIGSAIMDRIRRAKVK